MTIVLTVLHVAVAICLILSVLLQAGKAGGMGAAFGPALILALYWRRFNRWGALASVVAGTIISTWWWAMGLGYQAAETLTDLLGFSATIELMEDVGLWQINPAGPGVIAALLFAVAVTLLTSPPSREVEDLFDHVNGPNWTEDEAATAEAERPPL